MGSNKADIYTDIYILLDWIFEPLLP